MLLLKASLSPTSLGWSHTRSGTQYYKIGCAKNILAKYYRESAFNAVYRLSEHEAAIALSTRTPDVLWLSISLSTTRRTRVFVDERRKKVDVGPGLFCDFDDSRTSCCC